MNKREMLAKKYENTIILTKALTNRDKRFKALEEIDNCVNKRNGDFMTCDEIYAVGYLRGIEICLSMLKDVDDE